ncbi:MAG: DNA polymerase IV [Deltaproteobacteria bacterium]|nr:DNA polymerase IV [Deltaproteobacteria bacterium]
MTRPRTILHVDLDAFFAAVEQRDDPSLQGKPVIVGGSRRRGVVAAASYEVRRYGVHSAMPMAEALRRCPHAIVISHHFERYREASDRFFDILSDYSPLVESLSLDEAFVDASESLTLFGSGRDIAVQIRERVVRELGLVASVGIASSKFIAKIASDIDKPDGLRVVDPGRELEFLHPLPISRLWGVGRVTRERLLGIGLTTVGDVARYPEQALRGRLGPRQGTHLAALARGEDHRVVVSEHEPVTIGHEETFEHDRTHHDQLRPKLIEQSDRVASRLRRAGYRAQVIILKLKHADFRQITRRRSLSDPTSDGMVISDAVLQMLAEVPMGPSKAQRVRLCGVATAGLERRDAPRQLRLDEDDRQRGERLGDTLDAITGRFGPQAIIRRG